MLNAVGGETARLAEAPILPLDTFFESRGRDDVKNIKKEDETIVVYRRWAEGLIPSFAKFDCDPTPEEILLAISGSAFLRSLSSPLHCGLLAAKKCDANTMLYIVRFLCVQRYTAHAQVHVQMRQKSNSSPLLFICAITPSLCECTGPDGNKALLELAAKLQNCTLMTEIQEKNDDDDDEGARSMLSFLSLHKPRSQRDATVSVLLGYLATL